MSNYHATDSAGRNFKTKKAFREAVAGTEPVYLTDTSAFNNKGTSVLHPKGTSTPLAQLSPSDVIVGPDPYRQRNWYANIKNGKVV